MTISLVINMGALRAGEETVIVQVYFPTSEVCRELIARGRDVTLKVDTFPKWDPSGNIHNRVVVVPKTLGMLVIQSAL